MNNQPQSDIIRIAKNLVTCELTPVDEGGYMVTVVEYPSCASQGETIDEALVRAEDALLGCLTVDQGEGLPIPESLKMWLQQAREKRDREVKSSTTHRTYQSP